MRARIRIAVAMLVVGSTVAANVDAALGARVDHAPTPSAAVPIDSSPTAQARRSGHPVEIASATTETRRILANPDGTKTLEQYAVPVRARHDGQWAAIDPTLVRESNGTVQPRNVVAGVAISGGGTGPLVTVSRPGTSLSLYWPAALPVPRLSGDTATYPNVRPGVDLQVQATAGGFSELLVVRTPRAAADPALRTLRFRTATTGLTLTDRTGSTAAMDRSGRPVFVSGPLRMWESASAGEPGRVRDMGVRLGGGQLVISPDAALLADQHVHYPLYIDPSFTMAELQWTQVNQLSPNTSYWDWRDTARVGYYSDQDVTFRMRSLFQMDLSALIGTKITSATFDVTMDHSYSCTATPVDLHFVDLVLNPNNPVTYNNTVGQGRWKQFLARQSGYANEDGGCGPVKPDRLMEFSSAALLSSVQVVANGGAVHTETFGLQAPDESNIQQWKRFLPTTAKLLVNYDTLPRVPTDLSTVPPTACGTAAAPTPINTATPTFSAIASDPDNDNISTRLDIRQGTTVIDSLSTAVIGSGAAFSFGPVPEGVLPKDQPATVFSYMASSNDGKFTGPATTPCYFTVDTINPHLPTISSDDFPDGVAVKSEGEAGTVTISRDPADNDVAGFKYGFGQDKLTMYAPADATGKAIVPITLWRQHGDLDQLFYAKAVDRAGRYSPTTSFWTLTANPRSVTTPPVRADLNGDRRADITAVFDEGDGRTAAWNIMSNNTEPFIAWDSGVNGGFPMYRTKSVSGDFDGDGRTDLALLREDPDQVVRLYLLTSDGNGFTPPSNPVWTSTAFRLSHLQLAAGDFNGDAVDDLALLQGYAGAQTKLWVLFSNHGTFTDPVLQWDSGPGGLDIGTASIVAGDFNGDGRADLAEFRGDPANANHVEMWTHTLDGTQLGPPQHVGPLTVPWQGAQYLPADVDGDGRDEIVGVYDKGDASSAMVLITQASGAWHASSVWDSGAAGSLDLSRAVFVGGDYDGDGKDDLAAFVDIGGGRRSLSMYAGNGTAFAAPQIVWRGSLGDKPTPLYIEPDRNYRLYPQHSGKCLGIMGGQTTSGAPVVQWDCVAGAANQQFRLERIGATEYFHIKDVGSGKCLDIADWSQLDGAAVRQWTCDSATVGWPQTNQEFSLDYVQGSGLDVLVRPRVVSSGKCLGVTGSSPDNGATVVQYHCTSPVAPSEQYYLRPEA